MSPHVVDFYDLTPCCPFTTDTHNSLENTSETGIITSNYNVVDVQEQSMLSRIGTWFTQLSQMVQVAIIAAVVAVVLIVFVFSGALSSITDFVRAVTGG